MGFLNRFLVGNVLDTDSYKASHFLQYPPNTTSMYSYLESRGGRYDSTVFFGLQYYIEEYLSRPVTRDEVLQAAEFFKAHGEPFNIEGWTKVVERYSGRLPISIKAVPEGTIVPTNNVLMTVESTDPELFWIVSWVETQLVRLWYPITVATQSYYIKRMIFKYLQETSDDPLGEIPWKLHDFGSRGVSSQESAGIGGMAHLVNFQGSDTCMGVVFANRYYRHKMSGFSIPAAEHSTITMWGRDREEDAYRNMAKQFAKPGKIFACVSDSYDLFSVLENIWGGDLGREVEKSGATVVVRPDSGNPAKVVITTLRVLDQKVGTTLNGKGFKVLPKWLRVIQGDGVNEESIGEILQLMKLRGYSASNIAFGMGGALLQKLNRDTQQFAYKCSAAVVDGREIDVFKDPVTDSGKRSKKGRFSLVLRDGRLETVRGGDPDDVLQTVFQDGMVWKNWTLDEVRERAGKEFK